MLRRRIVPAACCLLLLLVAACGGAPVGDTAPLISEPELPTLTPPASTFASETTIPLAATTSSTSSSTMPVVSDSYFRYGGFGLVLMEGGKESTLVDARVSWAVSDFMGGVFYAEPEGDVHWLRQGVAQSLSLGRWGPIGLVNGRPTMLVLEANPGECPYEDYYWGEAFTALDLVTGARGVSFCDRGGPDGGLSPASIGGFLVLEIGWVEWGPQSDTQMVFHDLAGTIVDVPANPFPESCAPCQLSGDLSPDGQLLAYRHRPDAYWPEETVEAMTEDEWWAQSRSIPAEVVVVDLASEAELYRRQVEAWVMLVDFDGARLVLWDGERDVSTIVDLQTITEVDAEGRVSLIPGVAVDLTGGPFLFMTEPATPGPPPTAHPVVSERVVRFAGVTDPGASVTAAGKYSASVDEAGNWSVVLVLNPGPNLATFTATDSRGVTTTAAYPVTYEPPVELSADGLGAVSFGDNADEALSKLTDVFGPPSADDLRQGPFDGMTDGYMAFDYLRITSWEKIGLTVVFSDGAYLRDDGVPHMIAWHLEGPTSGAVATSNGLTVGATVSDVEAMYRDDLYMGEIDVCIATDFYIGEPGVTTAILGFLDGPVTDPDSTVVGLAAGAWPSC